MKLDFLFPRRGLTKPNILCTQNDTFIVLSLVSNGSFSSIDAKEFKTYNAAYAYATTLYIDQYQHEFGEIPHELDTEFRFFDLKNEDK